MPKNTKKTTSKLTLPPEQLTQLHEFARKVLAGESLPSQKKTEQAKQNLRKAGLIE